MIQNIINHITFVVDKSGSMAGLSSDVVRVFDNQVKYLSKRSKELNQETRVSVYLFSDDVECLIYDMDVMRLPSLAGYFRVENMTALIDGTIKAISDLKKTPELYGDHAFLIYVLTDGKENISSHTSNELNRTISGLADNWTLGVLVPDAVGEFEAKKFGFPSNNISIWKTTAQGIDEADQLMQRSTETFFQNRKAGIRGTKSLFKMDVNVSSKDVRKNLDELTKAQYVIVQTFKDEVIQPFVEKKVGKPYVKGSAYYQLVKPETIQAYKQICIQDRANGKVYTGDNARDLLGLPDDTQRVAPGDFKNFDIYIQSTSVNRKLPKGTKLVVLK